MSIAEKHLGLFKADSIREPEQLKRYEGACGRCNSWPS
jgi:hypothetical protein